ncbi:MAG: FeoB-associated Cys-rich membrane protein [Erysipelotrichaceae bacterium]
MLIWLKENLATIIICAILIVIVVSIIRNLINNKKKGISSCGCGCSNCPMSDCCHSGKN